jgi:hypothetical protein
LQRKRSVHNSLQPLHIRLAEAGVFFVIVAVSPLFFFSFASFLFRVFLRLFLGSLARFCGVASLVEFVGFLLVFFFLYFALRVWSLGFSFLFFVVDLAVSWAFFLQLFGLHRLDGLLVCGG